MAKATKNIIPPTPVVENFTVTLELSKEEARLLRDVLQLVGGSPVDTRRRYAASILIPLENVIGARTEPTVADVSRVCRSIYFVCPEEQ